jgi:hypothetical protein
LGADRKAIDVRETAAAITRAVRYRGGTLDFFF